MSFPAYKYKHYGRLRAAPLTPSSGAPAAGQAGSQLPSGLRVQIWPATAASLPRGGARGALPQRGGDARQRPWRRRRIAVAMARRRRHWRHAVGRAGRWHAPTRGALEPAAERRSGDERGKRREGGRERGSRTGGGRSAVGHTATRTSIMRPS